MNILFTVLALDRFNASPRDGHLTQALKIFGYFKKYPNQEICINPAIPDLQDFKPEVFDWTEQYPDAKEEMSPNMPELLGAPVWTGCYVDSDHAHDVAMKKSVTGFILL